MGKRLVELYPRSFESMLDAGEKLQDRLAELLQALEVPEKVAESIDTLRYLSGLAGENSEPEREGYYANEILETTGQLQNLLAWAEGELDGIHAKTRQLQNRMEDTYGE